MPLLSPPDAWVETFREVVDGYRHRARDELSQRWLAWFKDLEHQTTYEVISALLARQVSLATRVASAPTLWDDHVGGALLRIMLEVRINLAWILKKPDERSREFAEYGLGRLKLTLEQYRKVLRDNGVDPRKNPYVQQAEAWINSQRLEILTTVNVGSWSGSDIRKIADATKHGDLYRLEYDPQSGSVHSMWQQIGPRNLRRCPDPLHRGHRVPVFDDPDPDPEYFLHAASHLDATFSEFDSKTGVKVSAESAFAWLLTQHDRLYEAFGYEVASDG